MTDYTKELYNSLVETSMRVLNVLQAFERRLSFEDIRVLEIFAVYGEDVGYEKSLQHRSSARFHAYGFRSSILREALDFLQSARLVEGDDSTGYRLVVTDLFHSDSFVGRLGGDYIHEFSSVCEFMAEQAEQVGFDQFISRLTAQAEVGMEEELDSPPDPIETDSLVRHLERDYWRMDALQWTAQAMSEIAAELPEGLHERLDHKWLEGLAKAAKHEMSRVAREQGSLIKFRESLGYPDTETDGG